MSLWNGRVWPRSLLQSSGGVSVIYRSISRTFPREKLYSTNSQSNSQGRNCAPLLQLSQSGIHVVFEGNLLFLNRARCCVFNLLHLVGLAQKFFQWCTLVQLHLVDETEDNWELEDRAKQWLECESVVILT